MKIQQLVYLFVLLLSYSTLAEDGLCTNQGEVLQEGMSCCEGLAKNDLNKCEEPTYQDTSLENCNNHSNCAGSKGCFPQRSKDLFSQRASSEKQADEFNDDREGLLQQVSEVESPKVVNESCSHAMECTSYSCVSGKCEDKKVCRLADMGEEAHLIVECGEGMGKDASNKCVPSAQAVNPVYLGLLKEPTFKKIGECQYQLDEETRLKSIAAMKTIRAMEWLLATISEPDSQDCFRVVPLLREEVGKPLVEFRKNMLKHFSEQMTLIENDFTTLQSAKENSTKELSMHGVTLSEHELATRYTSGYDGLMIMWRRNLLFQSYETTMLEAVKLADEKIAGLSKAMATWQAGAKQWSLGENRMVNAFKCEAKYKKWKWVPPGWKTKYYDDIGNRWTTYYQVTGTSEANSSVVKKEGVANYLQYISGLENGAAVADFLGLHYLIDPLMPGNNVRFSQFGEEKKVKSSGFLGLGTKDLRKPRYLKGTGNGSYAALYNTMKPQLKDFYKKLKLDTNQKNFIYEPELVTVMAKDCIEKPENEKCGEFSTFLDSVLDMGFAQFLAYSAHSNYKYTNYFTNADSWRRRLMSKLETDLHNLNKYYEEIIKQRDVQNVCLEKVLTDVATKWLNQENEGIVEGPSTAPRTSAVSANRQVPVKKYFKVSVPNRKNFQFNLATGRLRSPGNDTLSDTLGYTTDSTAGASLDSAAGSGSLAKRFGEMKAANDLAASKGLNVSGKEKGVGIALNKLGNSSAFGGLLAANNASKSISSFAGGVSSLSANAAGEGDSEAINLKQELAVLPDGTGQASLKEVPTTNGKNTNLGTDPVAAVPYQDPTGMSDEEKEIIKANYERSKTQYQGNDQDGLFKKVSKAYVRNIDRLLTKKKEIKE